MQSVSNRFERPQPQSPAVFLLLNEPAKLQDLASEDRLRDLLADPSVSIVLPDEANGKSLIINWHGKPYAIFEVPFAVPETEFTSAFRSPAISDKTRKAVRTHVAHLVISPMFSPSDMGVAMTQSVYLMQIARDLGELAGKSLAYFWVNSGQVSRAEEFIELADQAIDALARHRQGDAAATQGLPLPFWVGINLFSKDTQTAGVTQGLAAYTGHELELAFLPWPESDVYLRVANIVAYLFSRGPVFAPGQQISSGPGETFSVSAVPADDSRPPTLVLQLADHDASEEDQ